MKKKLAMLLTTVVAAVTLGTTSTLQVNAQMQNAPVVYDGTRKSSVY